MFRRLAAIFIRDSYRPALNRPTSNLRATPLFEEGPLQHYFAPAGAALLPVIPSHFLSPAYLQNQWERTTLPITTAGNSPQAQGAGMARKINRRNFFIFDQLFNTIDRAQDYVDDRTLNKYEDYQNVQKFKQRQEDAKKEATRQAEKRREVKARIQELSEQVETLLHTVAAIQRRHAEIEKLRTDHPF
jgi:hypothetical protein